jgi:hypothetical protein
MIKRYFPFPLTMTTLGVVAVVTMGLQLSVKAGIVGLLLAVPLTAWFLRYCYVMVDGLLGGAHEPPAISADLVNVIVDRRPISQAVLLAACVGLTLATVHLAGFLWGAVCAGFLLVWLPASIAVLAVTGSPLQAIWPPHLLAYSRTCGGDHRRVMLVVVILGVLLLGLLRFAAPNWMVFTAAQLTLLIGFALVGGTMLEHRQELGIATDHRAQREAERLGRQQARLRERMLERAYLKIKLGKPLDGWREIQAWIGQHGSGDNAFAERTALLEKASAWEDVRPADRIADDLITMLLARRESGRALEVLEQRMARNPRFMPASSHRARLAELAGVAGKPALRRQLEAARAAATSALQTTPLQTTPPRTSR